MCRNAAILKTITVETCFRCYLLVLLHLKRSQKNEVVSNSIHSYWCVEWQRLYIKKCKITGTWSCYEKRQIARIFLNWLRFYYNIIFLLTRKWHGFWFIAAELLISLMCRFQKILYSKSVRFVVVNLSVSVRKNRKNGNAFSPIDSSDLNFPTIRMDFDMENSMCLLCGQ